MVCHWLLDGARLGYGLVSKDSDLSLADIARLCDVFYIGGTKIGALFGEAVVIINDDIKKIFGILSSKREAYWLKGDYWVFSLKPCLKMAYTMKFPTMLWKWL